MQNDIKATTATTATAAPVTPAKRTAKRPAKPATVAPVAPVAAVKPDAVAAAAERAKRIAADRAIARSTFATLDPATTSVAVKSFAAFKRTYKRDVQAHPAGRSPTERQAATLAFACLAGGKPVANGSTFPRRFTHAGRELAIENGALSDCIASGLATYDGAADTITLRDVASISAKLGKLPAKLA